MLKLAHYEDLTCYEATLRLYPDFLLHHSDEYMASLIQEIQLQRPEIQNIFVVCGHAQSRSIPYYLFMSPKLNGEFHPDSEDNFVKYSGLEKVTRHLPRYESKISRDSP